MSATLPTTVISPSVSKPRKSTRMTFTTFLPPAGSSALAKKNGASTDVRGAREHCEREHRKAAARRDRERRVANASGVRAQRAAARIVEREPPRQPAQPEQEQHYGHGLDRDLRERQIGRGKPREREAGDEPRPAEQDQRDQPMKLRLPGRADRTRRSAGREQCKQRVDGRDRDRTAAPAARPQRPEHPRRARSRRSGGAGSAAGSGTSLRATTPAPRVTATFTMSNIRLLSKRDSSGVGAIVRPRRYISR